jgi:hypothetical protein
MTMAKLAWMVVGAVVTLGAMPMACLVVDDTPGHTSFGAGAGNATGNFGGSQGTGGTLGSGGSSGGGECNPVTGAGCPSDGSSCDLDSTTGMFACFGPPNTAVVCGSCDDTTTFCGSGLTCVLPANSTQGSCYQYCCTDADCGAGGTCDTTLAKLVLQPANPKDAVGLCVSGNGPACSPPTTPPSGGTCVGGATGGTGGGGTGGGSNQDAGSDGGRGGHHDGGGWDSGGGPGGSDGGSDGGDGG